MRKSEQRCSRSVTISDFQNLKLDKVKYRTHVTRQKFKKYKEKTCERYNIGLFRKMDVGIMRRTGSPLLLHEVETSNPSIGRNVNSDIQSRFMHKMKEHAPLVPYTLVRILKQVP